MFQQVNDSNNGGKWLFKKKFGFALLIWAAGSLIALKGVNLAETTEQIVVLMSSYGTFTAWLAGIIFGADLVDKKYKPDTYHTHAIGKEDAVPVVQ